MRSRWIRLAASIAALGMLALAPPARADTPPEADATRIAAAGHSLKWNWTPPGRNHRYGHAETLIHAPIATVRQMVLDFSNYKALAPSITMSRVVGYSPDGSIDVYLRMGVLNNLIKLWAITRFAPLRDEGPSGQVLEGHMIHGKGNISDSAATWTMREAGPDWTVLKFDILLRPGLPAPESLIDEQLRDSAMDAVNSIHDRAQGSRAILPYRVAIAPPAPQAPAAPPVLTSAP